MNIFLAPTDYVKAASIVTSNVSEEHDEHDRLIGNSWVEHEYNADNQLTIRNKIKCEYHNDKLIRQLKYQHDAEEQLVGHDEATFEYDPKGLLTYGQELKYNADSQLISKNEFYYNKNTHGQMSFRKKFEYPVGMYNAGKKVIHRSNTTFSYSIDNQLISEDTNHYVNGQLTETSTVKYHAGKIMSKNLRKVNQQGQLLSKSTSTYNNQGKLIERLEVEYNEDNKVISKYKSRYAADGCIILNIFKYNIDNQVIDAVELHYNAKGWLIYDKKSEYADDRIVGSNGDDFDENGVLKNSSLPKYASRQLIGHSKSCYERDSQGRLIKKNTSKYGADGQCMGSSKIRYQYHGDHLMLQTEHIYNARHILINNSEVDFGHGEKFTSRDLKDESATTTEALTTGIHSWVNIEKSNISITRPSTTKPFMRHAVLVTG
ncbi:hypothetical protein SK355_01225 [Candidatus Fukatsuia symbiotica]|uniref:Uncharacterized protein n=1 Tax=Candidatus Fukatsuia symbiotica TaxID=1878942 RepID=A0A2U8I7K4_9GAMM|nr:hypothetical protein [Candidatus Fukatsuia symbiotica]AWK15152.1 hypothetical protein CCS41_12820 [Candidatus Fukatsuia symbiotica]MEA9443976.1 hypothetical protein [Candidatus Fukatsuia symbiotica]